jgi:type I restriction enzyme, S subunit
MAEWAKGSITEFFELDPGYAFKSADFISAGVAVIKIKNIKAGHFSEHEFSYVSPHFLSLRANKLARPGDLLISMSGNRHDGSPETWVGKIALFNKEGHFFVNQRVGALRRKPNAKIDIRFASYLLSSFPYQELFISIATSSGGQANLSPQQILSAPLSYPNLETQIAIGEVLGALDDKIDLNRRLNETLEATARAIFEDWFVDFGPTRAKMEGRGLYLAPEIWALFPDRLDGEGKPEGWHIGTLGEIACPKGQSVKPNELSTDTPYIGLEHMPCRSLALDSWEDAGKVTSGKVAFRQGDILFGKLRPYFHKVGIAPLDGICSTDIVVMAAKEPAASDFVLCCVSSDEFVAYTDLTSGGTKMPRTSWAAMERYDLCLPPIKLMQGFENAVRPFFGKIVSNIHETRTLAITRDLLLPKLMSGEIRVKDAEKAMEAVL